MSLCYRRRSPFKIFRQRDKEIRFIIVNRFFGPLCSTRCLTGSFQIAGHERDSREARTEEKKERKLQSLCKEVSLFARRTCPGVRETFRAIQKPIPLPDRRKRRIFDDDDRATTNHVEQKVSCKQIRINVCRTAIASHFCADFNWKTNGDGGDSSHDC